MATEGGRECTRDAEHAEQVRLQFGADVFERRLDHRGVQMDARVVDEDRHVGRGLDRRGHRMVVADIEDERVDPRVARRFRCTRRRIDPRRAALEQLVDHRAAEAAVAAGDERDGAVDWRAAWVLRVHHGFPAVSSMAERTTPYSIAFYDATDYP